MATLTAVDWDRREARVLTAALRGRTLRIEHAFSVAWSGDEYDVAGRAEVLRNELRSRGITKGEAIVCVSRSAVELKQLELPPAPDDDLPDLVRFQALRELHAVSEGSPLDFTASPAEDGRPRSVLVAALEAKYLTAVRGVCESAGLRVRRVLLRPCATASMVTRRFSQTGRPLRLTIDVGREEAEFVATSGHDVVLLRAARLPTEYDAEELIRTLSSELRRTSAAVRYQLGGRAIESIALCGTHAEHDETVRRLSTELELPVEIVDPTELIAGLGYTTSTSSDLHHRLAPLAGGLLDEAEGIAPAFDFLHPRKRRPPPNRRRQTLIGGAIAASLVLAGYGFVSSRLSALDRELAGLRTQSSQLGPLVKEAEEVQRRAAEVEKWLQTDVVWIDEMRRLAEKMPPARELMLTQFRAAAHPQGGEMQLTGMLADTAAGDALESALRDERHKVEGRGRRHDTTNSKYPWRFQTSIVVQNGATVSTPKGAR